MPANTSRSMLEKAKRPGDFRWSTFSWCRSTRISASSAARDRKRPAKAHQISLQRSIIAASINRFACAYQPDWVSGRDNRRIDVVSGFGGRRLCECRPHERTSGKNASERRPRRDRADLAEITAKRLAAKAKAEATAAVRISDAPPPRVGSLLNGINFFGADHFQLLDRHGGGAAVPECLPIGREVRRLDLRAAWRAAHAGAVLAQKPRAGAISKHVLRLRRRAAKMSRARKTTRQRELLKDIRQSVRRDGGSAGSRHRRWSRAGCRRSGAIRRFRDGAGRREAWRARIPRSPRRDRRTGSQPQPERSFGLRAAPHPAVLRQP